MHLKIKIRIFLWLMLSAVVSWLIYSAVVPGGHITYGYLPESPNFFISKLAPNERIMSREKSVFITGDPVYFSLRTPRAFNKAKLTLEYRNESPEQNKVLEAGVLADKKVWRYDLKPIENNIIDYLQKDWGVLREGDVMLLQKDNKFNTIEDFLANPPQISEIATYNYDFKNDFHIPDYIAEDKVTEIESSLRGPYQFLTYIKNENLNFSFDFIDMNKGRGEDPIEINLYHKGKLIASESLADDGEIGDLGKVSEIRTAAFEKKSLPEGVYKIEVKANDDVVTDSIRTAQRKMAFINRIWLYENRGNGLTLVSDSASIAAQTVNPASLQTIMIGNGKLDLGATYKQFNHVPKKNGGDNMADIKLKKSDIILSGNGVFSFDKNSFFNPNIKKINRNIDLEAEGINYIIASYDSPKIENGWKTAEAEFDLKSAYREKGRYGFLISVPGLMTEAGEGAEIEIKRISVDLEGKGLWEFLRDKYIELTK